MYFESKSSLDVKSALQVTSNRTHINRGRVELIWGQRIRMIWALIFWNRAKKERKSKRKKGRPKIEVCTWSKYSLELTLMKFCWSVLYMLLMMNLLLCGRRVWLSILRVEVLSWSWVLDISLWSDSIEED